MFTATSLASEEQERMAISQSFVAEAEVFDPFFGIRISNPKITLDTLNSFCSGIRKLQLNQINNAVCAQNNGEEWVTMGVLVERTECKKSANGNEYMIWRISDLKGLDAATVKVLLFGDSVRHYWKLQPGNTILLNNPQRADNPTATGNSGGSNECTVSLKVFKLGQIIELGFCPDFGQCQGRKAADGAQCTHFVNKARSLYCPFHLQQRARQVAANRGSLNRSANLPPKKWRQFKEPTTASFGQEEPTGLTTLSRRQSAAAAGGKSKTFTAPFSMVQRGLKRRLDTTESPETAKANLLAEEKLSTSTHSKNLRIMRRQNGHWDPKGDARMLQTPALKSMREFIQSQPPPKPAQNRLTPSFSSPPSTMTSPLELDSVELMKRKKAAQILRNKNAVAPNNGSSDSKQSKVGLENGEENATGKPSSSSKGSLLGTAFSTEQLQALLHKKSTHEAEADQEELNRQNSYFERGEVDEQIETNATSLMEIKGCRVVSCKECEYTSVHQSVYCKSQGHPVRRHQANKRFFKCMDCQRRTTCFDRMPTKACLGCKSKRFCRVAMRDERKVLLETEKLKIKEEENNFSTTADH